VQWFYLVFPLLIEQLVSVEGIVFVISGPAGVGKTTLCDRLLADFPNTLKRVVTATTRKPREGEVDGVDYHFLTQEQFIGQVNKGAFVEHECVHQNLYGTQKKAFILSGENQHYDLLLNIDVNGASSLKKFADGNTLLRGVLFSVFVLPSSIEELKDRLTKRGTDNQMEIETRLQTAELEIKRKNQFNYILPSKEKDIDYQKLMEYYLSCSNNAKPKRKD